MKRTELQDESGTISPPVEIQQSKHSFCNRLKETGH